MLCLGAVGFLLNGFTRQTEAQQVFTLTIATSASPTSSQASMFSIWRQAVRARSGAKVEVQFVYDQADCKSASNFDPTRTGQ